MLRSRSARNCAWSWSAVRGDHYAHNRQRFVVPVPCQGNHIALGEAWRNRGRYRAALEAQLLR